MEVIFDILAFGDAYMNHFAPDPCMFIRHGQYLLISMVPFLIFFPSTVKKGIIEA